MQTEPTNQKNISKPEQKIKPLHVKLSGSSEETYFQLTDDLDTMAGRLGLHPAALSSSALWHYIVKQNYAKAARELIACCYILHQPPFQYSYYTYQYETVINFKQASCIGGF